MFDTPDGNGNDEVVRSSAAVLREYIPYPYQVLTEEGTIRFVNDAWVDLLEYDPERVVGDQFVEYLAAESTGTFESVCRQWTNTGAIADTDIKVVDATGDAFPVTMAGRVEFDNDGSVARVHCQFVDVSQRERDTGVARAEFGSERTATEESLKLAIEGAQIGVWDWDMTTDEVIRDELLTNMLGYSPAEMGEDLSDWERLVHPEGRKRHNEALEEHIENRTEYYQCDYRMKTKSGDWKWVRTMGTVVERDADGTPVRAVGIHQDIDEQKRTHQKLASKTDQLEALNRVIRHDIRDQMGVVYGWAQELERHVDGDGEDALKTILDASQDIIDLTEVARDIVDSLESDDGDALEPVNLATHLRRELDSKREVYPGAEFTVEGEIPTVTVRANEMLSSVFRNVLVNAVKHNDSETPTVSIETDVRPDSVVVRIADNGPGIAPESMGAVFESGETGVENSGTGIGLYLVRSLVEEYGGDVWVERRAESSDDECGAVFVIELPRVE